MIACNEFMTWQRYLISLLFMFPEIHQLVLFLLQSRLLPSSFSLFLAFWCLVCLLWPTMFQKLQHLEFLYVAVAFLESMLVHSSIEESLFERYIPLMTFLQSQYIVHVAACRLLCLVVHFCHDLCLITLDCFLLHESWQVLQGLLSESVLLQWFLPIYNLFCLCHVIQWFHTWINKIIKR